jgi:hypothetical protein
LKVIVYVEGPSDKLALGALLEPLIRRAAQNGCLISFVPQRGKRPLLTKAPRRAVNILRNDRSAFVIVLPDLYPQGMVYPHSSLDELRQALVQVFCAECDRLRLDAGELARRFRVHCLKHDLEALLLGAEDQLRQYLDLAGRRLPITWTTPVEDQDFGHPPKRVVEELFARVGRSYVDTYDAPQILAMADSARLACSCPQCFSPFLEELNSLSAGGPGCPGSLN